MGKGINRTSKKEHGHHRWFLAGFLTSQSHLVGDHRYDLGHNRFLSNHDNIYLDNLSGLARLRCMMHWPETTHWHGKHRHHPQRLAITLFECTLNGTLRQSFENKTKKGQQKINKSKRVYNLQQNIYLHHQLLLGIALLCFGLHGTCGLCFVRLKPSSSSKNNNNNQQPIM